MQKYIKEVFVDYQADSPLLDAQIENINLYKKTNKLQVEVESGNPIHIGEVEDFENYLVKRFHVNKALIDIHYKDDVKIEQDVEKEWGKVIQYVTKKEPFSKAILTGSKLDISEKNISVKLALKGADFLTNKKFDKGLEHLLSNIYNENYSVKFEENLADDYMEKLEEKRKRDEEEALNFLKQQAKEEAKEAALHKAEEKSNKPKENKAKDESKASSSETSASTNSASSNGEAHLVEQSMPPQPVEEEDTPLIYGRSMNLRSDLVKIKDISVDTDKLVIDGELIDGSMDSREIKNGEKVILMFNVYDGTSSITCKAFLEKDKFKKVSKRIKDSKGLKI
jgi:DNA polymerase-3 subunit alpha (Gram-positive type)